MYKGLLLLFSLFFLTVSCAPKKFEPYEPPEMEIEETEEYDIDLDKIEKPEKPKPIFVDKDMEEVDDPDNAQFVVFDQEEYAKISAMVKLTGNYKEIILEQEELINTKIDIINSYKEYLKLEIEKSKSYRELWANAENQKRYEQWRSDGESRINKITWTLISAGGLVVLGIAL